MNENQKRWKENHIKALTELGLVGRFDTLRRLENRAHRDAELLCSGDIDQEESDRRDEKITEQVKALFGGTLPRGFFINGDPRGYALKINAGNEAGQEYHPEYIPQGLHTDWGGYGILAPEEF